MNILILAPYPPFPPHGGGTMRIYQIIRELAKRHAVTCLTFAPDDHAEHALAPLRANCRVVAVRGPDPRSTLVRAWTTLASSLPDMALRNAAPAFAAALKALLSIERFDVVQAESIEMAGYLAQGRRQKVKGKKPLLILDQFNAEYLLQKRAALTSLGELARLSAAVRHPQHAVRSGAGSIYSLVQWAKLARYERRVMHQCDAVVTVSDDDVRALSRIARDARYVVAPNGVETSHFHRAVVSSGPIAFQSEALVFSGTLDFRPNVDALTWFAAEVLPHIKEYRPDAHLVAVGRRPALALQRLAETGVLTLTGEVADARPFLAGAAVYVVPMRIGGGVRLKLLEALALEAPVVSTTMGAEGVRGLRHEEHCLLADTPQAFATAVLRLLNNQTLAGQLGVAGRALVCEGYDWAQIVPRFETLYEGMRDEG